MSGSFRILSLDGGGIRGAYSAAVLKTIEESTGKRIVDHFDLIVGTSTGGILAVALGLQLPAAEILEFYRERGPAIFPRSRWFGGFWRAVRWLFRSKHDARALDQSVEAVFGSARLGESKARLAITAYDVASNRVHVLKTAHAERYRQDYKRTVAEVIRATSAAPTYFQVARTTQGELLVDGGVWANCPAMVGVAEALSLGVPLGDIRMLSIGTLSETQRFAAAAQGGGLWHYVRNNKAILALLMDAQARGALSQASLLLSERLTRIDQAVPMKEYSLDDPRKLDELVALGCADGRKFSDIVNRDFLSVEVAPFVPIYSVGNADTSSQAVRVA